MPYLIETYKKHKGNQHLTLVNVDSCTFFQNIADAEKAIFILNQEQKTDNQQLQESYVERLIAQILDEDTEDTILREPTAYNYIYKVEWYSEDQILQLA